MYLILHTDLLYHPRRLAIGVALGALGAAASAPSLPSTSHAGEILKQLIPIETKFDGHRFRSRTEARWAVFFKALGLSYVFEPEGYQLGNGLKYLPDFWLPELKFWFECKGIEPSNVDLDKGRELCERSQNDVLIAVGGPHLMEELRNQMLWLHWNARLNECQIYGDIAGENIFKVAFWYRSDERLALTNMDLRIFVNSSYCWEHIEASYDDVTGAYRRAAYARFEHGETP